MADHVTMQTSVRACPYVTSWTVGTLDGRDLDMSGLDGDRRMTRRMHPERSRILHLVFVRLFWQAGERTLRSLLCFVLFFLPRNFCIIADQKKTFEFNQFRVTDWPASVQRARFICPFCFDPRCYLQAIYDRHRAGNLKRDPYQIRIDK